MVADWHNFGADYDKTLMAWQIHFDAAGQGLPTSNPRCDERFRHMWRYYLSSSAATFRTRRDQLRKLKLSPHGVPVGYRVPR